MSVVVGGDDSGELTQAFSLAAVEQFADPAAVVDEASEWSRHVGVVDHDRERVAAVVEEHGLRQDFDPGERDVWLAMEAIREETHTPRHVYVGATSEDRRIAEHLGWEFVHVTDAAEKADWTLAGERSDEHTGERGIVGRLRARISRTFSGE